MKVEHINLEGEKGLILCAIVSFNKEDLSKFYHGDGSLNDKGKNLLTHLVVNQHKSVFYHNKITVESSFKLDLSQFNLFERAGIKMTSCQGSYIYPCQDSYIYQFSIWSALEFYNDDRLCNAMKLVLEAKLQQDYPFVFEVYKNNIKKRRYSPVEKDLLNDATINEISLRVKSPFFVANQIKRHHIDLSINEVSRRYVSSESEFWSPKNDKWRKQSEDKKQASLESEFVKEKEVWKHEDSNYASYDYINNLANYWYTENIKNNMCAEQTRAILPLATYTEWIWTGSILAFANLVKERTHPHVQKETRDVAIMIADLCRQEYKDFDKVVNLL